MLQQLNWIREERIFDLQYVFPKGHDTSFLHFSSQAHPQHSLFPRANDVQPTETIKTPSPSFSRTCWSWQCMMRILLLRMTISSVHSLILLNFHLKEQWSCILSPARRWEQKIKQLRNQWRVIQHFQNLGVRFLNLPWMTYSNNGYMNCHSKYKHKKCSKKSGFESLSPSSQYV